MKALVVAAHPDDEVLGAGGTIAAMAAGGDQVHIVVLAEGMSLRHPGIDIETARHNCELAAAKLGAAELTFGGMAMDGVLIGDGPQRPIVEAISRLIEDVRPEIVFTHHSGDINIDHRSVAASTQYATRVLSAGTVREVLHFEVMSSTDQQTVSHLPHFAPGVFYDVSDSVDAKCEALECYPYEIFPAPHPRSTHGVRALAAYRGAQVGVMAAEAFSVGRILRMPAGRTAPADVLSGATRTDFDPGTAEGGRDE